SFASTLSLVVKLDDLRLAGAQVVVATHSPLLTALPDATILELGPHGIHRTEWANLAIVANWRRFLGDPEDYLRRVFR
ncbi:MAG: ABC transporter, partial [Actinoplanes sp.]